MLRTIASIAMAAAVATSALAQSGGPSTVPNRPYGDNYSLSSLRSYDQMLAALESSVKTSRGAAELHYGHCTSNGGRKVPYVLIGDGPTAVMIIGQQHGDEMEASDSAVN